MNVQAFIPQAALNDSKNGLSVGFPGREKSDGFEFRCDNGEKLRVTFAQDCCDREIIDWAAGTGGYDKETVQDVMLGAVEKRFGKQLPTEPLEWLRDNGSAYRAHETRAFARMLGLESCTTAVRSPESNGIAESFVKTIKRDYISIMPKADSRIWRWRSVITTNIIHTARWDIAHHGNIYAESYRNRKRGNASGYIGANPCRAYIQLTGNMSDRPAIGRQKPHNSLLFYVNCYGMCRHSHFP